MTKAVKDLYHHPKEISLPDKVLLDLIISIVDAAFHIEQ